MATLKDIQSNVWAISLLGFNVIAEGLSAIRQRMDLAIRTTKGTDPLRPLFGSDVYKYQDRPVNVAVPNIKQEIVSALTLWVSDVIIVSVNHYFQNHFNPVFEVTYRLADEELIDTLLFNLAEGATTIKGALNEVTLQASFPVNSAGLPYTITLNLNGKSAGPKAHKNGFATLADVFNWVNTNWSYLGRWFILSDKIVCYINATGIKTASLSISTISAIRLRAIFPRKEPGQKYTTSLLVNNVPVTPEMPMLSSPGDVLSFVQSNWADYADWGIEYIEPDGSATISSAFSDAFNVEIDGYALVANAIDTNVNYSLITNTI